MPWINIARLLTILRRRGEDPRDHTVYWEDEDYTSFKRSRPRYLETPMRPVDDEPESDEDEED